VLLADLLGRVAGCLPRRETRQCCGQMVSGLLMELDEVVPAAEIIVLIGGQWPLEPLPAGYPGEVATQYRYRDGAGEIGIIASVTQPFCCGCTRARLSAEEMLYTCLFAGSGHHLRAALRGGVSDQALREQIAAIWTTAFRPLLRAAHACDRPHAESGDVAPRRLANRCSASGPALTRSRVLKQNRRPR
jgi:hypothetical protein